MGKNILIGILCLAILGMFIKIVTESQVNDIQTGIKSEVKTVEVVKPETVSKWKEDVKVVAVTQKSKTEKYDQVMLLVQNYKPTTEEIKEFENFIIAEFKSGNYLKDIKNDEYMLMNVFRSAVVERHYKDSEKNPIDSFAFGFFQNTKYTYHGADAVDSDAVKSNEEQMRKALAKMK